MMVLLAVNILGAALSASARNSSIGLVRPGRDVGVDFR